MHRTERGQGGVIGAECFEGETPLEEVRNVLRRYVGKLISVVHNVEGRSNSIFQGMSVREEGDGSFSFVNEFGIYRKRDFGISSATMLTPNGKPFDYAPVVLQTRITFSQLL